MITEYKFGRAFASAKSKGCLDYLVKRIYAEFHFDPVINKISKSVAAQNNIKLW